MGSYSELDAVNSILAKLGQLPVSSLSGGLPADAEIALDTLRRVSRKVQALGWHFNSEPRQTVQADSAGIFNLGKDVLKADSPDAEYATSDVLVRDGKLWDRTNATFTFDADAKITLDLVRELDFDQVPVQVQDYIVARAAREAQIGILGDTSLERSLFLEERSTQALAREYESEQADHNLFQSQDVSRPFINRRSPLDRLEGLG